MIEFIICIAIAGALMAIGLRQWSDPYPFPEGLDDEATTAAAGLNVPNVPPFYIVESHRE